MGKKENDKRKQVLKLLRAQKIRDVKEIKSYKLSVYHSDSAGIEVCLVNPKKFRMVPRTQNGYIRLPVIR